MNSDKLDIIIPTWNSMPVLQNTIDSIKKSFGCFLGDIIIVDKFSTDGTKICSDINKCIYLTEKDSLGKARLKGLNKAKTKYIAFIDSDIILPRNWFLDISSYMDKCLNWGWLYGFTLSDNKLDSEQKRFRMNLRFPNASSFRRLKAGERGYTHNTICLREPLLNADVEGVYSWEDYVFTQNMIKAGYGVFELPVSCKHNHNYDIYKMEKWNMAGCRYVKGFSIYIFLKIIFHVYWGLRCSFHFRNINHLFMNLRILYNNIIGFLFYKKYLVKK